MNLEGIEDDLPGIMQISASYQKGKWWWNSMRHR